MTNSHKKNKILNFRLPAALALSLAAGIVYGTILTYFSLDGVFIAIPAVIAAVPFFICTLVYKRTSLSVSLALIIAFFLAGALYVYFYYCSYIGSEVVLGQTYRIEGIVSEVGQTSGGKNYIVITRASADGVRLNGKIIAYLGDYAGEYCEAGYKVAFKGSLNKQSFYQGGEVSFRAVNGIKYYCSVYYGLDSTWKFSLFGAVNNSIRNALFNNTDGETAAVCFAMLTGNSSFISEGTLSSFRNGGIAHVFAVSGLHIGVIFGALTLLFKKLPVNRFVSAAVRAGVIIFYAGVCGFTPSSVRAAVTCTAAVAASLCHKKYDGLNSLSFAAIILLLINPLYLYGVGFLLSFGAALGVMTLQRNISAILSFIPSKLCKLLSVGLAVNLMTIPTQFKHFGYISWAGLFLNIVIVPVVSVLYLLLFVCVTLSAVAPFSAVALVPFSTAPIQLIINLTVEFGFENAVITQSFGYWIYLPFILFAVGITDKLNMRLLWRGALVSLSFIWLVLGFATVGEVASGVVRVTFGAGNSGGSVVINTNGGTVIVVSEDFTGEAEGYTGNASAVVAAGGSDNISVFYALKYDCDNMFVEGGAIGIGEISSVTVTSTDNFTLYGIEFAFKNGDVSLNIDGVKISLQNNWKSDQTAEDVLFYCQESGKSILYFKDASYAPEECGAVTFEIRRGVLSLVSVTAG